MRIKRTRVARRPAWPWWAVFLPALWLALGGTALAVADAMERPVQLCLLKRFTGYPCPTCGFTRGTFAFLHGHPIEGWLYNPLLFSFLGLFAAAVGCRMLFGRTLRVEFAPAERRTVWVIASALFVANWLYVMRYVG